MATGYSGTPLAQKLGVKDAQRTWRHGMPASVAKEIACHGLKPKLLKRPLAQLEMAHLFVTQRAELAALLREMLGSLEPNGIIWVSWPKKSSKVATEITEDTVRAEALPLGLVDIKVCAVDEIWSGLKLVIRTANRTKK